MRFIVLVSLSFLMPISALASTARVAILPAEYRVVETDETSADLARQVEEKMTEGAKETGWEVLSGPEVVEAIPITPCKTEMCLDGVAEALGVEEAIYVEVKDFDGRFEITVYHTGGMGPSASPFGTDTVMLKTVSGLIRDFLTEAIPEESDELKDNTDETNTDDQAEPTQETHPKGVSPKTFWTFVGITGTLGLGYAVTDVVVYKKGSDLENTPPAERSQSDWESFKRAQVADRILFVTFLSSAAATAALLFLTDFDRNKDSAGKMEKRYVLAPAVTQSGGVFVFSGSF